LAGHLGLRAAQKAACPYARCLADPAVDSAVRYSAGSHCLADPTDDSAVHYLMAAYCSVVQRSWANCPAGCFAEHYFAERCLAAAQDDSRSAAAPGDSR
jgi:hypothetical protein